MLNMIDGHAHLHDIDPVEAALERAASAGVNRIVAVGMDLATNIKTLELAKRFPGRVFPAIGYHPWSIVENDVERTFAFLESNLDACVAVGEAGLDYKVKVKKPLQREVFSRIVSLAKRKDKPLIVHTRFSHERAFNMAKEAGVEKAVFHWYSGPEEILGKILDAGWFVSATPALARSKAHRAAILKAPLERILVETDAPVQYQFKTSEPATLTETVRHLAELKRVSIEEAARIATENAEKLYGI